MMKIPSDLRYCETHEWAKTEAEHVMVGVTEFAQDEMGDIVFVELPVVGSEYKKGESMAVIESVKAVSDIYAPISGTVVEVNESLNDQPELINEDCYGEGWMFKIASSNAEELETLMNAAEYEAHTDA
ncbi:MAG: glycine cleavage system protein GcvH [Firmicutes bacterium]|nr:glycine cleavage system protein GcvH [Bacillota bacterium]